jgi:hypothetical protein
LLPAACYVRTRDEKKSGIFGDFGDLHSTVKCRLVVSNKLILLVIEPSSSLMVVEQAIILPLFLRSVLPLALLEDPLLQAGLARSRRLKL